MVQSSRGAADRDRQSDHRRALLHAREIHQRKAHGHGDCLRSFLAADSPDTQPRRLFHPPDRLEILEIVIPSRLQPARNLLFGMPQNFSELAHAAKTAQVDAAGLESALRRHLRGEVRFDAGSRALYATDGSNYRQVPIGVVLPRDADDVIAAVALARKFGAPILARGGGTSLAGQCCNVAVVMDFSKYMHQIVELDPKQKFACVEPGIVLDDLRDAAEKHSLTFGPDPATHSRCTLGG